MSLVVSLRIADGIVIAADSLSTMSSTLGIKGDLQATCPHCNESFDIKELALPPIAIPASTMSFTEKLTPFHNRYAVGSVGMGILGHKTLAYHVRKLEATTKAWDFSGVSDVADTVGSHLHEQLQEQISELQDAPDDFAPIGAQVVGYDGEQAKTIELRIGKNVGRKEHTNMGCHASGDSACVTHVWDGSRAGKTVPLPNFAAFSLQDAVEYAELLIDLTARLQRFSPMLPTVGGDVDIALITEFAGFTWVKSKRFTRLLYDRVGAKENGEH
jgi:hypothetical protein